MQEDVHHRNSRRVTSTKNSTIGDSLITIWNIITQPLKIGFKDHVKTWKDAFSIMLNTQRKIDTK